jgi:UDP-N-acetylglucosamine 2-epimerase
MPTLLLWPNIDAGSDHISKAIRDFRNEQGTGQWLRTLTNLTPENYLKVLAATACAVGNSSSFVRDASYFGTPVVLVGNRQRFRETDVHVTPVPPQTGAVLEAVRMQLQHGRYAPSTLYGDGHVAGRFADAVERLTPYVQKHLAYGQPGSDA